MKASLNSLVLVTTLLDVAAVVIGPHYQYSLVSLMMVLQIPLPWLWYHHYRLDCVHAIVIGLCVPCVATLPWEMMKNSK